LGRRWSLGEAKEQAHKADEYVDLDEVEQAVRVFSQVIR